jgi:enoyl-CoA hydratase/carnithine racemase
MPNTSTHADQPLLIAQPHTGVLQVTLNRPAKRNALSQDLLQRLLDVFNRAATDSTVRVIVLNATGPVFCAGHDLHELAELPHGHGGKFFGTCAHVMQRIRSLPQPVIAKVEGLATAAGCQLAASCDLVVATENAQFATPGVKIGLFCTTPMVPLVRAIPPKVAMEMLMTGQPISARRAYELGLVNRVAANDQIDHVLDELISTLLATSASVLRLGKEAFYRQLPLAESEAYAAAVDVMAYNIAQPDAREGVSAFLAKRPPRWSEE